jgi:probable rRNA maturation factor
LIDVEVEDEAWTAALPGAASLARAAAEAVLSRQRPGSPEGLTILLADDAAVGELNARFREQGKPTNVLSFPAPANPEHHLGDVALAFGVCNREAREQGKALANHLQHLVAHGVLHLLGYDHLDDAEAAEMEGLERIILAGLGIADPYLGGEGDDGRP